MEAGMTIKLFGREITISRVRDTAARGEDWLSFLRGASGQYVSPMEALKVAAVYRCVDLLSKTVASLPMHMMRATEQGAVKATEHKLYRMVGMMPNPYTTAYEFWQCLVANLLLTRGGYAKIERDRNGYVTALWNIPTRYVGYEGTNARTGEPYIQVTDDDGAMETLYPGEFLRVMGFRFSESDEAEDPLRLAADVLGMTRDLNQFASTAFQEGINPGGFLETPGQLSKPAYERLSQDFQTKYAGVRNSGKYIILEEGLKATPFTRDMEKTQALESRKFAISEVCRLFGVPPHMCMDMDRATFSNIEQQSLEFVRDGLNPLCVRIEQAMFRDVLTRGERRRYFFKLNTNAILRGDTAARTAYYSTMRQNGIMNADEIRELEDMNRIEGGAGQLYTVNGNMIALENVKLNIPRGAQSAGATGGQAGQSGQGPEAQPPEGRRRK